MFKDNTLLITGGTGSFGNAVLDKFLDSEIKEIRILSRDEKKQHDMRLKYKNEKIKFYIGDVRDYNSVNFAMAGVDYVFSAAALKQVPSCEFYPIEAVKTNILGTENTVNAAIANGVQKMIALSTDKAVYPINAMGMSKALMEKAVVASSRKVIDNKTLLSCTRYGNVMASRGSVIPLFVELIKEGKDLTITDPNMTRFMMSLEDAVGLVLFAFQNGKQGDIFVQKSPACTILTLAKALQEIFKADNEIKIIGTRHGEKKHEALLSREEMLIAEDLGDYYRVPLDTRGLNYSKYYSEGDETVSKLDDYTSANTEIYEVDEMVELLLSLDYIQAELASWT
ncbi:polysaccharide biosynthesis domain protein [Lentisphaera araneosa HTCC2155]|uniref:UDP-glucose 4-epimerase n=1 Tax=Lentisphaera araneosa HTCC2155 TaxID=313628 RepID=A6DT12_9BACT|nr:polysaccharide biosynthesis protein [Lentisphaera araneosa]EDM25187.1 polysaccharide biosynthesis domain protein [Lentisphaera araneosa HTCC2155]